MESVYKSTYIRTIPMMQARAKLDKKYRKNNERGEATLFGVDDINIVPEPHDLYEHKPPSPPLTVENYDLDLMGERDIDLDGFDSHAWAEKQDL